MPQAVSTTTINEDKVHEFLGKVVTDFGATMSSMLGFIGMKLGLYDALAESGAMTSAELADKTGTTERYVREWLLNQASGGYVEYDPQTGKYSLTPEQTVALTDETSPFYVGGGFYLVKALMNAQPRISDAFQNGGGMLWGEHDPDLFIGTEKFFRPGYTAFLVNDWIPALTGIEEKLETRAEKSRMSAAVTGLRPSLWRRRFRIRNFTVLIITRLQSKRHVKMPKKPEFPTA